MTRRLEAGLKASQFYTAPANAASLFPSSSLSSSAHKDTNTKGTPIDDPHQGSSSKETEGFNNDTAFTIITPPEPSARGAQLSLLFLPPGSGTMQRVFDGLKARGVIGDERRPDVIRLAPAPLYNTVAEVERCVAALEEAMSALRA